MTDAHDVAHGIRQQQQRTQAAAAGYRFEHLITQDDGHVCALCLDTAYLGPQPIGTLPTPPLHPNCRCHLEYSK